MAILEEQRVFIKDINGTDYTTPHRPTSCQMEPLISHLKSLILSMMERAVSVGTSFKDDEILAKLEIEDLCFIHRKCSSLFQFCIWNPCSYLLK